jgi:hypothetical protein
MTLRSGKLGSGRLTTPAAREAGMLRSRIGFPAKR